MCRCEFESGPIHKPILEEKATNSYSDNITILAQDKPNIEIPLAQIVAYNIVPRLCLLALAWTNIDIKYILI